MPNAIETFALTKRFPQPQGWFGLLARRDDSRPAVNGVDLTVKEGELFGLLGPNGAGKTTLIKLLCTLIIPTSGAARVGGYDLRDESAIKSLIGLAASDERSFYWRLTGRQNLAFFAALLGLPPALAEERIATVLAQTGLEDVADTRFQLYSTGMRQRLSIARALLHQPRILFLDEPTKGLDPLATRQLRQLVRQRLVNQEGITVFLTTHILDEAEQLCDRVAIMHQGQLRGCGTVDELRRDLGFVERYRVYVGNLSPQATAQLVEQVPGMSMPTDSGEALTLELAAAYQDDAALDRAVQAIQRAGGHLRSVERQQAPLETVFEALTHAQPGASSVAPQPTPQPPSQLSPRSKPAPRPVGHHLRTAAAFLRRDLAEEISYRLSFFLQFFSIFFSVATFYFIARLLGTAAAPYLAAYGGDYFAFVLIGLAFSGFFGVGLSGFAGSLRQAQTSGTLEAMLITPTSLSTIILSSSLWNYLMTTFRVLVYLAAGTLLLGVDLGKGNYAAALVILLLTVVAFSSLGIISASVIMIVKRGDPVNWVISAVFSLLGGVYYPPTVLPDWMYWLSKLLPITYSLEAMRLALLKGASFTELWPQIGALLLFCAVFLPLSLAAFRLAVRRARIDGSLTHY